ncbi:MAG TPA: tRNA pseudouridine(38-40) synthase TruA, partial [Candidatus Omnitrophica bacterium]|nr:tRNA pseudouridine(38-40) synthase TruA [Candidatus Omnitrophota bacterium]
ISRGKNKPEFIEKILRSKNRSLAGPTVAAKGLYLARVKY